MWNEMLALWLAYIAGVVAYSGAKKQWIIGMLLFGAAVVLHDFEMPHFGDIKIEIPSYYQKVNYDQ